MIMLTSWRFGSDEKEKIEMEVYVNRATVSDLNIGVKKLEDILILHLVDGEFYSLPAALHW